MSPCGLRCALVGARNRIRRTATATGTMEQWICVARRRRRLAVICVPKGIYSDSGSANAFEGEAAPGNIMSSWPHNGSGT